MQVTVFQHVVRRFFWKAQTPMSIFIMHVIVHYFSRSWVDYNIQPNRYASS
jgi:hypothetical protein